MDKIKRSSLTFFLLLAGSTLLWSGLTQTSPDSYVLYSAAAILLVDGYGVFLSKPWVLKMWGFTLMAAAAYAVYHDTLPLRYTYYGPLTVKLLPFFLFGAVPFTLLAVVGCFLPQISKDEKQA